MQKLKAIITLIRLPNLVFIFLTQFIAYHFFIRPFISESVLKKPWFLLLALSTILIAAAGFMINDYFDIGIDAINKPERVTIEKVFKRRTIIIWHIVLNTLAILLAGFIAFHFVQLRVLGFQLISIFLLTVYSTTFKRKLIIGNLIISILTALTLLTIAAYEPLFPIFHFHEYMIKMFWLYMLFAFLITFSREVIKDIEDIKGDGNQHCKTIPLVWGIRGAKQVVYMIVTCLLVLLSWMCIIHFLSNQMIVLFYIILLILPLCFVLYQLNRATNSIHFHQLSSILKWITFAGILSMSLI